MRQAGRYLPEYQKIRSKHKNFMQFCEEIEDVVNVTMQPIKRFDLDAAIIFSDILVIPKALGYNVEFIESKGPQISGNIKYRNVQLSESLSTCYKSIKIVRNELPKDKALIGFAGAPWTLACYIFGKEKNYQNVKRMAYNKDIEFEEVFDILTEKVYEHLANQINNGADVVKIFDSWAGILDETHVKKLSFEPIWKIYNKLKLNFPSVPIIIFSKDTASHSMPFNPDCLAISYSENINMISTFLPKEIVLQGNLDPTLLEINDKNIIKSEVKKILDHMQHRKHIFNLGHGINPSANIKNIEYLIDCIRGA
jgi:uroporphyrinogen decarboxylase